MLVATSFDIAPELARKLLGVVGHPLAAPSQQQLRHLQCVVSILAASLERVQRDDHWSLELLRPVATIELVLNALAALQLPAGLPPRRPISAAPEAAEAAAVPGSPASSAETPPPKLTSRGSALGAEGGPPLLTSR
eukprot:4809198-Prymnesium_polylepis.1